MENGMLCAEIQRASLERDIVLRDAAVLQLRHRELRHRKPVGLPDLCDFTSRVYLRDEGAGGTSTPWPHFSPLTLERDITLERVAVELKFSQWELSHRFSSLPDVCDFTSRGGRLPTEFTPGQRFSSLTPRWMLERDIMRRNAELHASESSESSEDDFHTADRIPVP